MSTESMNIAISEAGKIKFPIMFNRKEEIYFAFPSFYYYNPNLPGNIETGETIAMFSLITRQANSVMKNIPNAMATTNGGCRYFYPKEMIMGKCRLRFYYEDQQNQSGKYR